MKIQERLDERFDYGFNDPFNLYQAMQLIPDLMKGCLHTIFLFIKSEKLI